MFIILTTSLCIFQVFFLHMLFFCNCTLHYYIPLHYIFHDISSNILIKPTFLKAMHNWVCLKMSTFTTDDIFIRASHDLTARKNIVECKVLILIFKSDFIIKD